MITYEARLKLFEVANMLMVFKHGHVRCKGYQSACDDFVEVAKQADRDLLSLKRASAKESSKLTQELASAREKIKTLNKKLKRQKSMYEAALKVATDFYEELSFFGTPKDPKQEVKDLVKKALKNV